MTIHNNFYWGPYCHVLCLSSLEVGVHFFSCVFSIFIVLVFRIDFHIQNGQILLSSNDSFRRQGKKTALEESWNNLNKH